LTYLAWKYIVFEPGAFGEAGTQPAVNRLWTGSTPVTRPRKKYATSWRQDVLFLFLNFNKTLMIS
jgi:hypothetical protein